VNPKQGRKRKWLSGSSMISTWVHSTGEENGDDRRNRTFALTLEAASLIYKDACGPDRPELRSSVLCPPQCDGCDLSFFV
jgi:hypothetical protein